MRSTRFGDDVRHSVTAPVVVGVDGSEAADAAVTWAAETAAQRGRELRIVHGLDLVEMRRVFEPYDVLEPSVFDTMRARAADLVTRCAQHALETAPGLRVRTEVSEADPVQMLLEYGATAHLVVLGACGATGLAAHVGSTMLAVTSHAEGVVVVVRGDPEAEGRVRREGPVVVGLDCGPAGEPALAVAFEEAAERRAELVAVHVWDDMNFGRYAGESNALFPVPNVEVREEALVAERLAGWQEKYPEVLINHRIYPTDAAATLLAWSRSARLVVSGSRGRGRLASILLGSTSNALVQHAQCPVMVVHPDDRRHT
ncbi:universal stress protein [Nocardia vaccinii]|uniref:universal stress protein n=1 Tax=Nocardia vaccinii TaxID=1822 RepID=UPI00082BDC98|nr:universal stress protein [Nocardia vaccinii]